MLLGILVAVLTGGCTLWLTGNTVRSLLDGLPTSELLTIVPFLVMGALLSLLSFSVFLWGKWLLKRTNV